MKSMDCTQCERYLADLLLDPQAVPAEVRMHLSHCADCAQEIAELRSTMEMMDDWTAPEPSAFFDARLHARLREAQAEPEGLWERLSSYLHFGTGRGLRPAMAGVLGVAMLIGGGTAATVLIHHGATPAVSSPTVNDLKIYDNNAQAVDQMDMLDDAGPGADSPQS